jgi:hypothetical protein
MGVGCMLTWLNQYSRRVGIVIFILSILSFSLPQIFQMGVVSEVLSWTFGVFLVIFSILHFSGGFKRSAGFFVWGSAMLIFVGIGVYLSVTTEVEGVANFTVIPVFVILHTVGVFRSLSNRLKKKAGIAVDEGVTIYDELPEDFPNPDQYLVHDYIQNIFRQTMYPSSHIENVDVRTKKIRSIVFIFSTVLIFAYLIFLALEIQIPGMTDMMVLIILVILIYLFIFGMSFYIRGFAYALSLTATASILIPMSVYGYDYLSVVYQQSQLTFWIMLIALIVLILVSVFLVLRYQWRKNYRYTTIFRRKTKFIAFAYPLPMIKPFGNTAFTISLALNKNKDMFLDIMQNRPADMIAYRNNRWALAGISYDEDACEAKYLIYAHPLAIQSIERYFGRWNVLSVKVDAYVDPTYEEYKKYMPTLAEYFSVYNSLLIFFSHLNEIAVNGSIQAEFRLVFDDLKQMDEVEPLFEQEHLTVFERHDPGTNPEVYNRYGGFVLHGQIPVNVGMATQMTKRIIDLISPFNGELYHWNAL